MSIKTILLHLNDERRARQIVTRGAELARGFEAHLIGLHVFPAYLMTPPGPLRLPAEIIGSIKRRINEDTESVKAAFNEVTSGQPFVAEWRVVTSERRDPAKIVMDHGRAADLIVASQSDPDWDLSAMLDFPERLAIESGRPVFVVPNSDRPTGFPKRISVAWNGRRESARAVFDALPFLKRAESVNVFTVVEGGASPEGVLPDVELAATLARHGIKITTSNITTVKHSVGETIHEQALAQNADLLVLGAYGHSRLREFAFSGVTRHILKAMTIPVLFSH